MANIRIPRGKLWLNRLIPAEEARGGWIGRARDSEVDYKDRDRDEENPGVKYPKGRAAIRTLVAALRAKRIEVRFQPDRPEETLKVRTAQAVLNWNNRVDELAWKSKAVSQDGAVLGLSVSYTTWSWPGPPVEVVRGEESHAVPGAATERTANASGEEKNTQEAKAALKRVFPHELTAQKLSVTKILRPYDFLIDPGACFLEEARWAAHRIWKTKPEIEHLIRAKVFRDVPLSYDAVLATAKDRIGMPGGSLELDASQVTDDGFSQEEDDLGPDMLNKLWELWICHDFRDRTIDFIVPGTELELRGRENPFGNPYADYRPNMTTDEFWPDPDSFHNAPAQEALNEAVDGMVRAAQYTGKGIYFLPDETGHDLDKYREKIALAKPGDLVGLPSTLLRNLTKWDASIAPEALRLLAEILPRILTEGSGIPESASGVLGRPSPTATEVGITTGFGDIRIEEIRTEFERWLRQVCSQKITLLNKFFTKADAVPLLGLDAEFWNEKNGEETFSLLDVVPEKLKWTYDFEIFVGKAADSQKAIERKLANDYVAIAAPLVQAVGGDLPSLLAWHGEKFDVPRNVFRPRAAPPQAGIAAPPQPGISGQNIGRGPQQRVRENGPQLPEPSGDAINRSRVPDEARERSAAERV